MRQIREDIEELRRLIKSLSSLERKRKLRNRLKFAILGFLIWRDLAKKIAEGQAIRKTLSIRLSEIIHLAQKDFEQLVNNDSFISKKEFESYKTKWLPIKPLLFEFKEPISLSANPETMEYLKTVFKNGTQIIKKRNIEFIRKEQEKYRDFFDHFGDFPLSEEQRIAIITDEHSQLVVAGAGSGKTTTIAGKVAYLHEKGIRPEEILCLAYGVEVKNTIIERVGEEYSENVRTIHGFGRHIVHGETDSFEVSTLAKDIMELRKKITDFIVQRATDKIFREKIKNYFLEELEVNYRSLFDFR
jgi:DNA helicase-4